MARQGGVHISYLIVAIVICLGLVGFIVTLNSDREGKANDIAGLKAEVKRVEDRHRQAQEELFRAHTVLVGAEDETPDYDSFEAFLENAREEWAKATDLNKAGFRSLHEFCNVAYDTTKHWRNEFDKQRLAAESKDTEYVKEVQSKDTIVAAKLEELNELKRRNEDLQTQLESSESDSRDTARRLREQLEERAEENRAEVANKEREIWVLRNQFAQARRRIEHLEGEIISTKTFDQVDPDGQVIQVAEELGYAWINLGRRDRMRAGLVFDVFSYVKGGKKLRKGQLEIMSVEEEIAKARVTGTLDRFNPVSEGDYITSPFYSKEDMPTFVFAGEKLTSEQFSLEEIARRIQEYGGKVEDEVKIETTFVVAIAGYEASPQFASARRLGITILGERDLLNFVGY